MATKSDNLRKAKEENNDEFYTQLDNIIAEIAQHPDYVKHFEGKTVLFIPSIQLKKILSNRYALLLLAAVLLLKHGHHAADLLGRARASDRDRSALSLTDLQVTSVADGLWLLFLTDSSCHRFFLYKKRQVRQQPNLSFSYRYFIFFSALRRRSFVAAHFMGSGSASSA